MYLSMEKKKPLDFKQPPHCGLSAPIPMYRMGLLNLLKNIKFLSQCAQTLLQVN